MAKSHKRRGLFIPLVLVVGLAAAAVDVFPVRLLIAQNREAEVVGAQLKEIQADNARLQQEIRALRSPAEIERIARADFGYVRPGDLSYVIILDDTQPLEEQTEPEQEPAPASGGFWEALWDYLTGRDISDG